MKSQQVTTNALDILDALFLQKNKELSDLVRLERKKIKIAEQLKALRKDKKMTQSVLAKLMNTSVSVISRIEDADYDGHTLSTVERFCQALGYEFSPEFKRNMAVSWTYSSVHGMSQSKIDASLLYGSWAEFSFLNINKVDQDQACGEDQLGLVA